MPEQDLINAIALAIASALSEHGIRPEQGNPTLKKHIEALCQAYGGRSWAIPETWIRGAGNATRGQPQPQRIQPPPPPTPKPKRATRGTGFGRDDWVL